LDGCWRTLDAAVISQVVVTVSEICNTIWNMSSVSSSPNAQFDSAKRPIREIVSVTPRLDNLLAGVTL
jgi:hypothetical protein